MANEKHETLAEIVAEMRHGLDQSWHDIDREWAHSLADRIEAAAMREREELEEYAKSKMLDGATIIDNRTVGNAAAMREALEKIYAIAKTLMAATQMRSVTDSARIDVGEIRYLANAALAKPPRNCDVGTAEEQEARYRATGELYHILTLANALKWAQMPYEGGAK